MFSVTPGIFAQFEGSLDKSACEDSAKPLGLFVPCPVFLGGFLFGHQKGSIPLAHPFESKASFWKVTPSPYLLLLVDEQNSVSWEPL